ncbi:MAG: DUF4919 domain-containing protein [Bacteroidales bacterium]
MQKLLFLIVLIAPLSSYSQISTSLQERAQNFYENEEYEMARVLYDSLLSLDPDNSLYLENAANSNFYSGNTNRALELYRKARKMEPTNPSILFNMAALFDLQEEKDSAIYYFNLYISLNPSDPHAYNRLAILYLNMEGYEDSAISISKKAILKDPDEPGSYYVNAMAYLGAQRPVDAIFAAKTGLEKDSTFSLLYIPLGLGYFYRNDYAEANRYFETGLEYASDKNIFIDYAVQSRLLKNTDKENTEFMNISEIRFKEFRAENLNSLVKETNKKDSPWYYPELIKKFNTNPLEFGLDEFFMLYIGFTNDKNYSPYNNENEKLEKLLEEENYNSFLDQGRKYLIKNPADFPKYLDQALISEYFGMNDSHYTNLFCYYGFLKAITASGNGSSIDEAMIVTYVSHEYAIASEMDYDVISQSLLEEKTEVYDLLKVMTTDGEEKNLYFNISIPYSWLGKTGLKK